MQATPDCGSAATPTTGSRRPAVDHPERPCVRQLKQTVRLQVFPEPGHGIVVAVDIDRLAARFRKAPARASWAWMSYIVHGRGSLRKGMDQGRDMRHVARLGDRRRRRSP